MWPLGHLAWPLPLIVQCLWEGGVIMQFLWPRGLLYLGAIVGGGKESGQSGCTRHKRSTRRAAGANTPSFRSELLDNVVSAKLHCIPSYSFACAARGTILVGT